MEDKTLTLGTLIKILEKQPLGKKVKHGFGKAHSYRGYYNQVAFEPKAGVDVHYMLLQAKAALGTTYTGYKGGKYKMTADTTVNLAHYGMCSYDSDELTEESLLKMLTESAAAAD
jgi:hypothetical protein